VLPPVAAAEPGEEQAPEVPVKGLRSVSSIAYQKGASIATVDNVMTRYPLPPKKGAKKEEKKAPAAPPEPKVPETMSVEKAMQQATSWNNSLGIANKFSVGTLTTAKYQEKVSVFDKMNAKAKEAVGLLP